MNLNSWTITKASIVALSVNLAACGGGVAETAEIDIAQIAPEQPSTAYENPVPLDVAGQSELVSTVATLREHPAAWVGNDGIVND
jgi:hypothetical protein